MYAHTADISYQYTELRPAECTEEEDESTLEYDDLDLPPAKKLATEEEIAKERYVANDVCFSGGVVVDGEYRLSVFVDFQMCSKFF